jgi:hypothetical protein
MRTAIYICLLVLAVPACVLESGSKPPAASDDTTTSDLSSDATITPFSGCAHVIWCDEPGAGGTVCKQDGCSVTAAKSECLQDLKALGCQFHCPARIELLGGGSSPMCEVPVQ